MSRGGQCEQQQQQTEAGEQDRRPAAPAARQVRDGHLQLGQLQHGQQRVRQNGRLMVVDHKAELPQWSGTFLLKKKIII